MKLKSKLDKLKMPEKKKMDMSDMGMDEGMDLDAMKEHEMHETPEEEASESPEEEKKEEDLGIDEDNGEDQGKGIDLSSLSDDDLLAELKKRGLMDKLEGSEDSHEDAGSGKDEDYMS